MTAGKRIIVYNLKAADIYRWIILTTSLIPTQGLTHKQLSTLVWNSIINLALWKPLASPTREYGFIYVQIYIFWLHRQDTSHFLCHSPLIYNGAGPVVVLNQPTCDDWLKVMMNVKVNCQAGLEIHYINNHVVMYHLCS